MRRKPKQPKTLIIAGIVGTVILGGIGLFVVYYISQIRQVTPETTEAATCCTCTWTVEPESGTIIEIGKAQGVVQENQCTFTKTPIVIAGVQVTECRDIPNDEDRIFAPYKTPFDELTIKATETQLPCQGGCITHSSDPVFPPDETTKDNNEVTFTANFELRYALPGNERFTDAELIFEYPRGQESPEPVKASTLEELTSYSDAKNPDLTIKVFQAKFETTWDTVINFEEEGTYKVSMRALEQAGDWTDPYPCTREFEVEAAEAPEGYCNDLDIRPIQGVDTLDATLSVDAGIPEVISASFNWRLDLNCNGQIDSGTGDNAEEFTIPAETNTITRTFTYPDGESGPVECLVEVEVELPDGTILEEISEGSCSGSVTLTQTTDACGNGTCETGETCDPDGNLACPSENSLPTGTTCRENCTYCGDGNLDSGEECDPGILQGEIGYEANCLDNCTIESDIQPPGGGDEEPAGGSEGLVITQQTPDCLELVSPNNTAAITITVTNNGSSATQVRAISDSLPQGVTYVTGSSTVNGVANSSDTGVIVEMSGSSQLVTWDNSGNGWTIAAGGTLTIAFRAVASSSATMGTHQNIVTLTPTDGNPIPSEANIIIAQTCTQPLTGIFDNNLVAILAGSIVLVLAGAAYYSGFGSDQVAKLLGATSRAAKKANAAKDDLVLKVSQPQKHMEKSIEKSAFKKILEKADDKPKKKGRR